MVSSQRGRAATARVVRGGSWNNNQRNARCAYRNRNIPDNYNNNLGFRVVVSIALCRGRQTSSFMNAWRSPARVGPRPAQESQPGPAPVASAGMGAAAGQITRRPRPVVAIDNLWLRRAAWVPPANTLSVQEPLHYDIISAPQRAGYHSYRIREPAGPGGLAAARRRSRTSLERGVAVC
jgi:hypothetical protein